jgi:hypothetical protein
MFVDYGIACPRGQESATQRYSPETERKHVIGTLKWASLNAHRGLRQFHFHFCIRTFLKDLS